MKKKVRVAAHNRNGTEVEAHDRIVDDTENDDLAENIRARKRSKTMSDNLFSFAKEEKCDGNST